VSLCPICDIFRRENLELRDRVKQLEDLAGGFKAALEAQGLRIDLAEGIHLPPFQGTIRTPQVGNQ